jgi:hypothetical protein
LLLRFDPLPVGAITLTADGWDRAGHHSQAQLSFTIGGEVAPFGEIFISDNAEGRGLMPGDLLRVTVAGPVNGTAYFTVGNWHYTGATVGVGLWGFGPLGGGVFFPVGHSHHGYVAQVPMAQLQNLPGTYRGGLVVPALGDDETLPITVVVRGPGGRVWTGSPTNPVQFLKYRPLLPRLVSPAPGAHVGSQATIEGFTEPYAMVTCVVAAASAGGGTIPSWSTQLVLYSDGLGHFRSDPVQLGGPADGPVTYALSAVATMPNIKSGPAVVQFAR